MSDDTTWLKNVLNSIVVHFYFIHLQAMCKAAQQAKLHINQQGVITLRHPLCSVTNHSMYIQTRVYADITKSSFYSLSVYRCFSQRGYLCSQLK